MLQAVDLWPTMEHRQLTCCRMCRLKKGLQHHVNIRRADQLIRIVQAIPALQSKDSQCFCHQLGRQLVMM